MREIKFRAWEKIKRKMFYLDFAGFTISDPKQQEEDEPDLLEIAWGKRYHDDYCHSGGTEFEIMQYTGLRDKNGKEIYEGDIVRNKNRIGKIIWKEFAWQTEYTRELNTFYLLDWYDLEVIGNTHETH